jgi:hypothetical protein
MTTRHRQLHRAIGYWIPPAADSPFGSAHNPFPDKRKLDSNQWIRERTIRLD